MHNMQITMKKRKSVHILYFMGYILLDGVIVAWLPVILASSTLQSKYGPGVGVTDALFIHFFSKEILVLPKYRLYLNH